MKRFIVAIMGVGFLAIGVFMYMRNQYLIKNCTVETEAIVVDMKEELSSDNESTTYTYYPIVEYTAGEEKLRVTMSNGSTTPAYNIDEKVTILYNPNKTREFIVKGEKSSTIFSIVFIAIGVFVTGCGLVMAFKKD